MRVKIGTTEYHTIRNLTFAPDVDVTCQEIPSNEFAVDIVTSDEIAVGAKAELYGEDDTLWASYWIYDCYRKSRYVWRVIARDLLWLLDNRTMYQSMYDGELVSTVIARIFKEITDEYGTVYTLDSAFTNTRISGYLPQGKARDRLQQVCFVIGAYIKTTFNGVLQILKLPDTNTATTIPNNAIFSKPDLQYDKAISGLRIFYYEYTPIERDDNVPWIEVNGTYYQIKEYEVFVSNPNAIAAAGKNEIEIRDIGVLGKDNLSEIVKRLCRIYFDRVSLVFNAVNNGDYVPAGFYSAWSGIPALPPATPALYISGYITSENFTFGNKPRSNTVIKKVLTTNMETVDVDYIYNDETIDHFEMSVPQLSQITLENPYLDRSTYIGTIVSRSILYPNDDTITTPPVAAAMVVEVEYNDALTHYKNSFDGTSNLIIVQVDEVDFEDSILTIKG